MGASTPKKTPHDNDSDETAKRIAISAVICLVFFIMLKSFHSGTTPENPDAAYTRTSKRTSPEAASSPTVTNFLAYKPAKTRDYPSDRKENHLAFFIKKAWGGNFVDDEELLKTLELEDIEEDDNDVKLDGPKMAWLLSYPNSGTSFTITTLEHMSNMSMATNYGDEVTTRDQKATLTIYGPDHPEGPFWKGMGTTKFGKQRQLATDYVLVKTHCSARCLHCPPSVYMETLDQYTDGCRNTTGRVEPYRKRQQYLYPTSRVKKVVHILRNPFHNIIARFHQDIKNAFRSRTDKRTIEDTPEGFADWCKELDTVYKEDEKESFSKDLLKLMKKTPCHGELYKYIQWHNLAFELVEKMDVPSLEVYYEDYEEEKYRETLDKMAKFLELPNVEDPREFSPRKDYAKYYPEEDVKAMRALAKEVASSTTWKHISHYYDKDAVI